MYRVEQRRRIATVPLGTLDVSSVEDDPALTSERAEEVAQVASLCERLTDRQRRVVTMRLSGATRVEVGQSLGVSAGRVREIEHRAVFALQRLLVDVKPAQLRQREALR